MSSVVYVIRNISCVSLTVSGVVCYVHGSLACIYPLSVFCPPFGVRLPSTVNTGGPSRGFGIGACERVCVCVCGDVICPKIMVGREGYRR